MQLVSELAKGETVTNYAAFKWVIFCVLWKYSLEQRYGKKTSLNIGWLKAASVH